LQIHPFDFRCKSTNEIVDCVWFLLRTVGCYQDTKEEGGHASLDTPMSEESDISNTTQLTSEEEKENDRKLMEQWTRMFFNMGRTPQQGEQILIFPGLFSK
jgi:hypothetical protein